MRTTRDPSRPIAVVCGQLGYGGAERQLTELALRLPSAGFAPSVFCLGGSDQPYGEVLRAAGIPVLHVARRGGFDLGRAWRLAGALRGRGFELAHSFLIDTNPYAWVACRLAGVRRLVASNRNADFPRGAGRARLDGFVFRSAGAVVVNAAAVRDFTARRFGVPLERFTVIYNGVDLERFRPAPPRPGGRPRIGTVGALEAKKNPAMFVDVATRVRERVEGLEVRHLGEGPMRSQISGNGAVEFLGTSRSAEEFLRDLDVFVLTSNREGCANVLLEAMACGLPIVTTDAGGSAEVVRDGETGFVVAREDRTAMVDRLCALLADPDLRRRFGAAARADAERRFSVERMVADTTALYRRLLDPQTGATA